MVLKYCSVVFCVCVCIWGVIFEFCLVNPSVSKRRSFFVVFVVVTVLHYWYFFELSQLLLCGTFLFCFVLNDLKWWFKKKRNCKKKKNFFFLLILFFLFTLTSFAPLPSPRKATCTVLGGRTRTQFSAV